MKKYWIDLSDTWQNAPMAYWVHREIDGMPWYQAKQFDPPAPEKNIQGKYRIYNIEIDGFVFIFSSIYQFNELIKIFSKKIFPSTIRLSKERTDKYGPNSHWLARLPGNVKNWEYRQKAVKYFNKINKILFK